MGGEISGYFKNISPTDQNDRWTFGFLYASGGYCQIGRFQSGGQNWDQNHWLFLFCHNIVTFNRLNRCQSNQAR